MPQEVLYGNQESRQEGRSEEGPRQEGGEEVRCEESRQEGSCKESRQEGRRKEKEVSIPPAGTPFRRRANNLGEALKRFPQFFALKRSRGGGETDRRKNTELHNSGKAALERLMCKAGIPSGFKFQVSSLPVLRY